MIVFELNPLLIIWAKNLVALFVFLIMASIAINRIEKQNYFEEVTAKSILKLTVVLFIAV